MQQLQQQRQCGVDNVFTCCSLILLFPLQKYSSAYFWLGRLIHRIYSSAELMLVLEGYLLNFFCSLYIQSRNCAVFFYNDSRCQEEISPALPQQQVSSRHFHHHFYVTIESSFRTWKGSKLCFRPWELILSAKEIFSFLKFPPKMGASLRQICLYLF